MKRFITKLRHGAPLTEADERQLETLSGEVSQVEARRDIEAEGAPARALPLIIDGWACRYQALENGKRQIIGLYIPGDLCEPFGAMPQFTDFPIAAITAVSVMSIHPDALRDTAQASPAINTALWWDLLVASAVEREHIVSLGRRSASERLGHLFCELQLRLAMVGLADETGYELPISQADLGDLLGLTAVHVNRSLQDLRREGLITLKNHRLTIQDLETLRALSLFDATYLHPHRGALR